MKIKKIKAYILATFAAALVITGCGGQTTSYTQAGMDAMASLDYAAAAENFEQAIANGEDERLILRGQGMLSMTSLNYDEAAELFTRTLRLSDGVPEDLDYDLNYYLAAAYYNNGQPEEAVGVYDAILNLRPGEYKALYLRGTVKLEQGSFDEAYGDFTRAMELSTGNYDLAIDIYKAMAAQGYKEAGRDMLSQLLAANSGMSEYDMGRFSYYLADYEEARTHLEKADKGDEALITLYLGRTYEALGDYNYAISLYNSYLDKDHSDPRIYNQMGLCQMKMERYSEALSSFQAAINQEDASILQTLKYNEIVAYEYMEEYQTAASLMKDYLKLYPNDEAAAREYEFLKTR